MPVTVSAMAAEHVPALAALEQLCFSEPWSAAALREELDNPHAVFLVATDDSGDAIGYVGMHRLAEEGYITNIAVFPAARRQGVARTLLDALAAYADSHRMTRLTLEVRPSNTAAVKLYEQTGYVLDGIRPGFYRLPPEDAAIYSRYRPTGSNQNGA